MVASVYQKNVNGNVLRSKDQENFLTKFKKLAIISNDDKKTPEHYQVNSMVIDEIDFLFLDKYRPQVCSLLRCDLYSSLSEKNKIFLQRFRKKICL